MRMIYKHAKKHMAWTMMMLHDGGGVIKLELLFHRIFTTACVMDG